MRILAPLAALTTVAALTAAPTAHADDAKPSDSLAVAVPAEDAPVVHYPPPSTRWKLAGIGLLVTGAAWGASFASGQNWSTVPGASQLRIPVAGPWIALGKSGCATDEPDCAAAKIGIRGVLYVLSGITQLAGLGLIAEAIVMKTEAPRERSTSFLGVRYRGVEIAPVPITSPTMNGIGLVGTF